MLVFQFQVSSLKTKIEDMFVSEEKASISHTSFTNKQFPAASPEPSILRRRSSGDHFGDEDAGVFTDVRVVSAACDAEAQPRVSLETTVITVLIITIRVCEHAQDSHFLPAFHNKSLPGDGRATMLLSKDD